MCIVHGAGILRITHNGLCACFRNDFCGSYTYTYASAYQIFGEAIYVGHLYCFCWALPLVNTPLRFIFQGFHSDCFYAVHVNFNVVVVAGLYCACITLHRLLPRLFFFVDVSKINNKM